MSMYELVAPRFGPWQLQEDGETARAVPKRLCRRLGFSPGPVGAEFSARLAAEEAAFANAFALEALTRRDYGARELLKKMTDAGIDEAVAAGQVERLLASRVLDDHRYAARQIDAAHRAGHAGRAAGRKLSAKGVDDALTQELLAGAGPGEEAAADKALAVCQRRYASRTEQDRARLTVAAMARRGFSFAQVKAAVERMGQALDAEEDSL